MGFGRKDDTWGIGWGWELAGRAAASTKNPRTLQWMPSWTCDNRLLPSRIKQTAKGYLRGNTDMDIQMPTPTNASVVVWEFLQWKLENDAAEAPWAPTAHIYFITFFICWRKKMSGWTVCVDGEVPHRQVHSGVTVLWLTSQPNSNSILTN